MTIEIRISLLTDANSHVCDAIHASHFNRVTKLGVVSASQGFWPTPNPIHGKQSGPETPGLKR